METFEIWMEGYAATGQSNTASLLSTEVAYNWDEAVAKYMVMHPDEVDVREKDGIKIYSVWACRLFDNEVDARKSFG